jgi:hypothetical protein
MEVLEKAARRAFPYLAAASAAIESRAGFAQIANAGSIH